MIRPPRLDRLLERLPEEGRQLMVAAWAGTAVFTVSAFGAIAFERFRVGHAIVSLALFGVGCVAFLAAYARAVERSRTEEIGVGGLYLLAGSSPTAVRWHLLGAAAVQTVVAFVSASIRPFTALAFGILVPMFGLGMAGLWAARHGRFPPRTKLRPKRQTKAKQADRHE